MLTPVWSGRFKRDVKRAEKRGKDMTKLKIVLSLLIEEQPLPAAYGDHPLKGDWKGFRDLHMLLYRVVRWARRIGVAIVLIEDWLGANGLVRG